MGVIGGAARIFADKRGASGNNHHAPSRYWTIKHGNSSQLPSRHGSGYFAEEYHQYYHRYVVISD